MKIRNITALLHFPHTLYELINTNNTALDYNFAFCTLFSSILNYLVNTEKIVKILLRVTNFI
jgi:hypothetical protein